MIFIYGIYRHISGSIRNILYAIIGVSLLFIIQHRIIDSETDRVAQWTEAIDNIQENPWFGYGLLEYDGELADNKEYGGSHNAYLSIFMQYGLIFGSLVIFIFFRKSLLFFLSYKNPTHHMKIYLCI